MISHEKTGSLGAARLVIAACRLANEFELGGYQNDSSRSLRVASFRLASIACDDTSKIGEHRFLVNASIDLLQRSFERSSEERSQARNVGIRRKVAMPTATWLTEAALAILIADREHRAEAAAILRKGCAYEGLMAHVIDYFETNP